MKKKKLTRNLSLKIMSVLIGFLIWFIVVNVDNPVSSKSITIPGDKVELQNTAYVDSANMMCMQDDDPDSKCCLTWQRMDIFSRLRMDASDPL